MKHLSAVTTGLIVALLAAGMIAAPKAKKPKPRWEAGPFMGEYAGEFTTPTGDRAPAKAQVVGTGAESYRVLVTAWPKGGEAMKLELTATADGKKLLLTGSAGSATWSGQVSDHRLKLAGSGAGSGTFDLKYVARKSPTEGAKPPAGATVLLERTEGKPSLAAWQNKKWQALRGGVMQVGGGDTYTVRKLKSFKMHLEFRLPYEPTASEQGRGNSGVYIHDRYEVQVLDSFGQKHYDGGCGAIYRTFKPKTNESFPPLAWQTYDITFRAAKLGEGGVLVSPPVITVIHNGVVVHQDQEIPQPTGAARKKGHIESNFLRLQDHAHSVQYRNVWVVESAGS
jgi:hypothetical protein